MRHLYLANCQYCLCYIGCVAVCLKDAAPAEETFLDKTKHACLGIRRQINRIKRQCLFDDSIQRERELSVLKDTKRAEGVSP